MSQEERYGTRNRSYSAWRRPLKAEGFAGSLSIERMAQSIGARTIDVSAAIKRLVEFGLVAIKPGAGGRANTYLPALPKRNTASMAEDDAPPF